MKRWLLLLLSAVLAACATTAPSPQETGRLFNDPLFVPPSVRINAADVFAPSPEMSYPPAEWIAQDPKYWGRKAMSLDRPGPASAQAPAAKP